MKVETVLGIAGIAVIGFAIYEAWQGLSSVGSDVAAAVDDVLQPSADLLDATTQTVSQAAGIVSSGDNGSGVSATNPDFNNDMPMYDSLGNLISTYGLSSIGVPMS